MFDSVLRNLSCNQHVHGSPSADCPISCIARIRAAATSERVCSEEVSTPDRNNTLALTLRKQNDQIAASSRIAVKSAGCNRDPSAISRDAERGEDMSALRGRII